MYQRKTVSWIFNIGRRDFLNEELFLRFLSVNAPGVAVENVSVGDYSTTFTAPASASGKILALKGSRFNAKALYVRENRQRVDAAKAEQKGRRRSAYPTGRSGVTPSRRYGNERRSNRGGDDTRRSSNAYGVRSRGTDETRESDGRAYGFGSGGNDGAFRERTRKPYGNKQDEKGGYPEKSRGGARKRFDGTRKRADLTGKDGRGVGMHADGDSKSRFDGEKARRADPKKENGTPLRNTVRVERYRDGGERPVRAQKKRPVFDDHGVEYVNDPIREGNYRPKHRVDINKD